jgi:prevent-host-death family protein
MVRFVNVREGKTHFSHLVELAHAGTEIILVKGGMPYARLMPLASAPLVRRPGRLKGRVDADFREPLPGQALAAWERG